MSSSPATSSLGRESSFETSSSKGPLFLLLASVFWSLGGLGIRLVDAGVSAAAIAGMRSLFALPVILIFAKMRKIPFGNMRIWWKELLPISFCYAMTLLFFVLANRLTTSANAILLQYTGPLYVLMFSHRFLGEKVERMDFFLVLFGFLGVVLILLGDLHGGRLWGNLAGLVSGVFFGGLVLLTRKGAQRHKDAPETLPLLGIAWGNALLALVCLPSILLAPAMSPVSSVSVAVLGLFQIGLAYVLYSMGIRSTRALHATLLMLLEPALNPVWVAMVAHEYPSLSSLVGGAFIVGAATAKSIFKPS